MSTVSGTQRDDPAARDPALHGDHSQRSQVATDMEQIFRPLSGAAVRTPPPTVIGPAPILRRALTRQGRIALFLGLPLLATLMLAAAAGLFWLRNPPEAPAPLSHPRAIAIQPAVAPPPPSIVTVRSRPTAHPKVPPPRHPKQINGQTHQERLVVATSEEKPVPPKPSLAQCTAGGGSEAWCLRAESVAADARLRGAYQAAVLAKVDRRTLAQINKKWVRLRKHALKEPAAMISGYSALTAELNRHMQPVTPGSKGADAGRFERGSTSSHD